MAEVRVGTTAAVLGAGPIGLSCLAALKASGARRILCADRHSRPLVLARTWGAGEIFGEGAKLKENAAQFHPDGTDLVVEASGDPEMLKLGIALARPGGTLVLAGHFNNGHTTLAPDLLGDRNLRVLGAGRTAGYMEAAAAAAGDGLLRTEDMITHRCESRGIPDRVFPRTAGRPGLHRGRLRHVSGQARGHRPPAAGPAQLPPRASSAASSRTVPASSGLWATLSNSPPSREWSYSSMPCRPSSHSV